jgi:uncharacterized protein (TIGR00255 family)
LIRSMTGFGDASEEINGAQFTVELRSLNNRYFKASIRLPEEFASLEAELETKLRQRVNRGSITMQVRVRQGGAAAAQRVNDDALLAYLEHLETLHKRVAKEYGDDKLTINLTELLALPGVLQSDQDGQDKLDSVRPVLLRLLDRACDRLDAMRLTEGKALATDLARHRQVIRTRLDEVALRAPQVVEEYHTRLRTRIDELLKRASLSVGQQDLIREVAIFAERSDIAEEVTRLSGHLTQFEQIVGTGDGEPAGRTLDFLSQEMLREANTIASKSNDGSISRAIVEVKGSIDRIKEQVQNIE